MENVKIQELSELISRDLRPSSVIFSWEISAPLTRSEIVHEEFA